MNRLRPPRILASACVVLASVFAVEAQCPEEPRLQHYTGAGQVVCPCFVEGEHAGAVFDLPPSEFPIEIVKVGIGWGSQFGGTGSQLEDSINLYEGGLPDPGPPTFTFDGPQLTDGFVNEFDLTTQGGDRIVESGPFTVTLRFLNDSTAFGPSVVHDNNGCQAGKNVVYDRVQGAWVDGCVLGIGGDWVFYVVYRKVDCGGGTGPGRVPDGDPLSGPPLNCSAEVGGDLTLTWSPSCSGDATDYEIYEGTIGSYYSHFSKFCSTGGATTYTFTPSAGDRYYIVVPRTATREGSYGLDGAGSERPTGGGSCANQEIGACP